MGLFKFIKSQFIEVIEWTDNTSDTMVYQFPVEGKEIKMGAQLTVRESQAAVFINEGKIADVFGPGRYILTTQNMPVLTKLKSWKYGFDSPFKAEVYFVNTKQFTDQKWGTTNPIMMRDSEFGMLRLRGYGNYSYRVTDPEKFMKEIFGSNSNFTTHKIGGQLRSLIVSGLTDLLGEAKIPALDLAMQYDELSEMTREKLDPKFNSYGFSMTSFYIENISLPEEVEKVMDKRTSMGVLGNLNQYTQYQSAEAIRDAAQNENGMAGAGVGFGAGAAIGNMMGQSLKNSEQNPTQQHNNKITCPHCNGQVSASAKFCSLCGKPLEEPKKKCSKCKAEISSSAKFCPQCGEPQNIKVSCDNCGAEISSNTKFCPECGNKRE
ncbi:SPFH domain-containing protein [Sporosalibacterium faouarense]|uniref:SPFH domain-containing protein n=1 Tax=Sporosalibacterium faouarense TaxID=516123 RepID=UPI00141C3B54|nr:SPFH domain-containing protein [Sporosalibacterium faouarense]MTI47043.1 zinc-ribbon domain-containing protein [Bacillota bacterium]